jgi:hypothetical protein
MVPVNRAPGKITPGGSAVKFAVTDRSPSITTDVRPSVPEASPLQLEER